MLLRTWNTQASTYTRLLPGYSFIHPLFIKCLLGQVFALTFLLLCSLVTYCPLSILFHYVFPSILCLAGKNNAGFTTIIVASSSLNTLKYTIKFFSSSDLSNNVKPFLKLKPFKTHNIIYSFTWKRPWSWERLRAEREGGDRR